MAYGVINLGRVQLREDSLADLVVGDLGQYHLNIAGQESMPRVSLAAIKARAQDITGLQGQFLPVTFSQKPEFDGFYVVHGVTASYDQWSDGVAILPWSMTLLRAGGSSDLDMESRLSGPLTRANDHSGVGVRWNSPAIGHKAWSAGSTLPGVVDRTSSYGTQRVYTGVPLGENPRWGITPASLLTGRCRILDGSGFERLSRNSPLPAIGWQMDNGLVRVDLDASGRIVVAAWTSAAWRTKSWRIHHGTGPVVEMGIPDYCTILRNDFEMSSIRLTKSLEPGRITADLTLRRGSRFLEIYVQHQFGTTLKISRLSSEAGTASTGYITATAADTAGNKFVIGSSKSFTNDLVVGGISKAATPTLDAFVGVEITGAGTGDLAVDLFKQYLGIPSETVQGVSR